MALSVSQQLRKANKLLKENKSAEARALFEQVLQSFPQNPSAKQGLFALEQQELLNDPSFSTLEKLKLRLNQLYTEGKYSELARVAESLLSKAPDDVALRNYAGVAHRNLGNLNKAQALLERALTLDSANPVLLHSLGQVYRDQGKIRKAKDCYQEAVRINSSFPQGFNSLGLLLIASNQPSEAMPLLKRAIELNPKFAAAHANLGLALARTGNSVSALQHLVTAVELEPENGRFLRLLATELYQHQFSKFNAAREPVLLRLVSDTSAAEPAKLAYPVLSHLACDPEIKFYLDSQQPRNAGEFVNAISILGNKPLLVGFIVLGPLCNLRFEALLTRIRSCFLNSLSRLSGIHEQLPFLVALSNQCFLNEYIYAESVQETELISSLECKIDTASKNGLLNSSLVELICLSCFRPLTDYAWSTQLENYQELSKLYQLQVAEPLAMRRIGAEISTLTPIEDSISSQVREQYEENPYPRWVRTAGYPEPTFIAQLAATHKLRLLNDDDVGYSRTPAILVAGCGTGRHAIQTATRFANCRVTAVDLSRSSLGYARYKADQMGLTNIEFKQADILQLHQLDSRFDLVESVGVLHHMKEPAKGLSVLCDLLKPGGLIRLGFYSELARACLKDFQIISDAVTSAADLAAIRLLRQEILTRRLPTIRPILKLHDFYSASEFRDLFMHVQEHQFSCLKLQTLLDQCELRFAGFELGSSKVLQNFQQMFTQTDALYELNSWHEFEKNHPDTFAGMYIFWTQKPLVT